jgi:hypothetical protein
MGISSNTLPSATIIALSIDAMMYYNQIDSKTAISGRLRMGRAKDMI